MANPVLSESMILTELDHIASLASAPQLKNAAKLTVIDAFDRRPNREPFIDLVTEACSFQANLSRLEFAENLRALLEKGKLDKAMLDEAIKGLVSMCEERREVLMKQFKPVTEMRHDTDPLH